MTPMTAADLHALFEPIRAKGWEGWPMGLTLNQGGYDQTGWSGTSQRPWRLDDHDGTGLHAISNRRAADLLLAAGLRWLAEKNRFPAMAQGCTGAWLVALQRDVTNQDCSRTGSTPYHALAGALRAVLGMENANV